MFWKKKPGLAGVRMSNDDGYDDLFESTTQDSVHVYRNRITLIYIAQVLCVIGFCATATLVQEMRDVFTYIYTNPYYIYTATIVVESLIFIFAILCADKIAKSAPLRIGIFIGLNLLEWFNTSIAVVAFLDSGSRERDYLLAIPVIGTLLAVGGTLLVSPAIGPKFVEKPYKTVLNDAIIVLLTLNILIVSVCHDVDSNDQSMKNGCTVGNYVNSGIGFTVMMFFMLVEFVIIQFYNDFTLSLSSYFEMDRPSYQVAQNLYIGTLFMFMYILYVI